MPEPKLDSIGREATYMLTPGATVDLGRKSRCGFGEVIQGGKGCGTDRSNYRFSAGLWAKRIGDTTLLRRRGITTR